MKKKYPQKENNKIIKFVFLAGFVLLLAAALLLQAKTPQSQGVASEFFLFRKQTNYVQKKAIQIGWFKIFRPTATPAPTQTPVTPTPCPGGTHAQASDSQSVAFAPAQPTTPLNNNPPVYITQTLPTVTQKVDPCITP